MPLGRKEQGTGAGVGLVDDMKLQFAAFSPLSVLKQSSALMVRRLALLLCDF